MPHNFYEQPLQAGGIRTGTLDTPQPLGPTPTRVAFIDTGAGLRYTVALDRGGDIIDATHMDTPLAYLTPNGLTKPEAADGLGLEWLRSWAGGLVTTCGPMHLGRPIPDTIAEQGLHGRHHLTPAAILAVQQPDPRNHKPDFALKLQTTQARMFGPHVQTTRTIAGTLGQPAIRITDTLTNLGDQPIPEATLYHCNLGYPLVAPGATLDIPGDITSRWGTFLTDNDPDAFRTITEPRPDHAGSGEGGAVFTPTPDTQGNTTVALHNPHRNLTLNLTFHVQQLPSLAIWQHLSHAGYVCGIEPFIGPTPGPDSDGTNPHPPINPGQSKTYELTITLS